MKLINGKRYRLPGGRMVTARETSDGMLLEFDRKSIEPIEVDPFGLLIHKGEVMRQTTDLLTLIDDAESPVHPMEMEDLMRMVFELKEMGGKPWAEMWECVRKIHARAKCGGDAA